MVLASPARLMRFESIRYYSYSLILSWYGGTTSRRARVRQGLHGAGNGRVTYRTGRATNLAGQQPTNLLYCKARASPTNGTSEHKHSTLIIVATSQGLNSRYFYLPRLRYLYEYVRTDVGTSTTSSSSLIHQLHDNYHQQVSEFGSFHLSICLSFFHCSSVLQSSIRLNADGLADGPTLSERTVP